MTKEQEDYMNAVYEALNGTGSVEDIAATRDALEASDSYDPYGGWDSPSDDGEYYPGSTVQNGVITGFNYGPNVSSGAIDNYLQNNSANMSYEAVQQAVNQLVDARMRETQPIQQVQQKDYSDRPVFADSYGQTQDQLLQQLLNYGGFSYNPAQPTYTDQYANTTDQLLRQLLNYGSFSYDKSKPSYYDQYAGDQNNLYRQLLNYGNFSFDGEKPTYQDSYADQMSALVDQLLNRRAFEYDPNSDPAYAAYQKAYAREGDRAAANALAQSAAATGGRVSSWAQTAASQASDAYAAKLADMIPTLYNAAYQKYLNEDNRDRSNLSTLSSLSQQEYNRFLNALGQYNTERSQALNEYQQGRNNILSNLQTSLGLSDKDYNRYLNALGQYNTERSQALNEYQQGRNDILSNLQAAMGLSDRDYERFLNELNQYNANRNQALNEYQQGRSDILSNLQAAMGLSSQEYARFLDTLSQYNAENQLAASIGDSEWERDFKERQFAAEQDQQAWQRDFDAYQQAWEQDYKERQLAAQASKGSGSSTGSGTGAGTKKTSDTPAKKQDYDGLFQAAKESGYPEPYIANNYKDFGFTSSSGLKDAYKTWEKKTGYTPIQDIPPYMKDWEETDELMNSGSAAAGTTPKLGNAAQRIYQSIVVNGRAAQTVADAIEDAWDAGTISDAEAEYLLSVCKRYTE